jgi:hypothetical protein
MNSSGAVQYTTFIGGSLDDAATGIALQGGNLFLVGNTQAGSGFPTIIPLGVGGGQDAFVAELNSGGSLLTTTVLGGSANDTALGIAVDGSGNIYLAGETLSSNFPLSASPFQNALSGTRDGFVTKLTSGGGALSFSTYLGGNQGDSATGIALDNSNNVYVSGVTASSGLGNPSSTFGGGPQDGFVAKFDASIFSTSAERGLTSLTRSSSTGRAEMHT